MCERQPRSPVATGSDQHLRMLLREKDPGFFAALELAVELVDSELSAECPETVRR
jgi:hypothetical protein